MSAITWRNVEGRSLAEAAVPLARAQESLETGLSTFDRMLQQRNAVQSNNWDIGKTNNTNELQALIASAKTPEELAALEGQINEKAVGYNGQVDATVLRTGLRDGLTALRTQDAENTAYATRQREIQALPFMERANLLIASKDPYAGEFIRQNAGVLGNNAGVLLDQLEGRTRKQTLEKREDTAYQMRMTEADKAAKDAELARREVQADRDVEEHFSLDGAAYKQAKLETGRKLGQIGTQLKMPVNSAGEIEMAELNPDQRKQLAQVARQQGIDSEAYFGGDTKAFTRSMEVARKAGIPETAIQRNIAKVTPYFSSNTQGAPIGNDLAKESRAAAENDVGHAKADSWYAPGSSNARSGYQALYPEVDKLVTDAKANKSIHSILQKIVTSGVNIGKDDNGKPVMIVPSPNDVIAAIRATTDSKWYQLGDWNVSHGENMEKKLIETLTSPESIARFTAAQKAQGWQDRQEVQRKLKESRQPSK